MPCITVEYHVDLIIIKPCEPEQFMLFFKVDLCESSWEIAAVGGKDDAAWSNSLHVLLDDILESEGVGHPPYPLV